MGLMAVEALDAIQELYQQPKIRRRNGQEVNA